MPNQKQIEGVNKTLQNPNLSLRELAELTKRYISLH